MEAIQFSTAFNIPGEAVIPKLIWYFHENTQKDLKLNTKEFKYYI